MQQKVKPPAIALLVSAILSIVALVAMLALEGAMNGPMHEWIREFVENSELPEEEKQNILENFDRPEESGGPLTIVFVAVNVVGAAFVAFAAWRMMSLKNYGLAVTASILAMIPCTLCYCCCLGLPIGIWSLIVLLDKDVKAAFDVPTTPPPL